MTVALLITGSGFALLLFVLVAGGLWCRLNIELPDRRAAATRRQPVPQRYAVTATVIPPCVPAPPQQLAVSFWEPRPVKGEIER